MAQPYFNQAQGLFNQSAAPISGSQINQYLNPYAGNVLAQLQNVQGQQMQDLTGRATQAAGGIGADRIGVAQGQLANQQSLATGQTLAGIYGSALGAAQQDAQRQQASAYGIGNLGGAAQNAAIQGTGALYGSGATQQQLAQSQLNSQYQNQLQQAAFPYQQAQYLAGITGGLAGAMGGITNTSQYGQSTPAPPSPWSQAIGLGTAGLGAYGATGGFGGGSAAYGGGSAAAGDAYGGSTFNPLPGLTGADYGFGYARGGFADGGGGGVTGDASWMASDPAIPNIKMQPAQIHQPQMTPLKFDQPAQSNIGSDIGKLVGTAAQFAPLLLANRGGAIYPPHMADGGDSFDSRWDPAYSFFPGPSADQRATGYGLLRQGVGTTAPRSIPGGEPPPGLPVFGPDGKMMGNQTSAQGQVPVAAPENSMPTSGTAPAHLTVNPNDNLLPAYGGSEGALAAGRRNQREMQDRTYEVPYDVNHQTDPAREFGRSPWLALINAGAAIAGGSSPYAGVNIGKGLGEGVKTLEAQRKSSQEEETINQRARQLAQQAEFHRDEYTKMKPSEAASAEQARSTLEQNKWQLVYDQSSGKSFWSKPGETPIPALPGQTAPVTPNAPNAPVAGNAPPQTSTDFSYKPPSPDPANGPGPIFNPKTGVPTPENAMVTRKDMEDARTRSNAASDQALQLSQMKNAFQQIDNAGSSWFQTGAFATQKVAAAKAINGVLASVGLDPIKPDVVGSAEELGKLTTRLGFALSRTLGAREAQQIVQQAIGANPGIENTPAGRKYILASMDAAIQREKESSQFTVDYYRHWHTTIGAQTEFNRLNPPEKYVTQAAIASAPPEFQNPKALENAVKHLRESPNDPKTVGMFNKIYHGAAPYFLKAGQP